jgi:hypothetical protein
MACLAVVAETSEWFDWMRREIAEGGVDLPTEETSIIFAMHALHLRDRIRDVYHHLPTSLEHRLVASAIVYQCWQRQKSLQQEAKWPGIRRSNELQAFDATSYIRPTDMSGRHHLVEASNGLQYVVTVPTAGWTETLSATEVVCNELLRLMGLNARKGAVIALAPKLRMLARTDCKLWSDRKVISTTAFCLGFQVEATPANGQHFRQLMGTLVFDIWTLNLSSREPISSLDSAAPRIKKTPVNNSGCLMGANWTAFCDSTFQSLPAPQPNAPKFKHWKQLEPWLRRLNDLDLNSIWTLASRMPPQWHGGHLQHLAHVLDMLENRKSNIRSSVHNLASVGYLPNIKLPPRSVGLANSESQLPLPCSA